MRKSGSPPAGLGLAKRVGKAVFRSSPCVRLQMPCTERG